MAGFMREQWLQKCAGELRGLDPTSRSVTDIAFSWGVNSSAHFSRLFSERFGVTPREYRTLGEEHLIHKGINIMT